MNNRMARRSKTVLAVTAIIALATLFITPGVAHAEAKCDALVKSAVQDIKKASDYNETAAELVGFGDYKNAAKAIDSSRFLMERALHSVDQAQELGCNNR